VHHVGDEILGSDLRGLRGCVDVGVGGGHRVQSFVECVGVEWCMGVEEGGIDERLWIGCL